MKDLLIKRRRQFLQRCLKYLRYVLNDHFVVVLLFLSGVLMVEYSRLLKNFPENPWLILLVLVLGMGMLLFSGRIATYVLPADKQFLLAKEEALGVEMAVATRRSFYLHSLLLTLVFLGILPILLAAGLPWTLAFVVLGLLIIAKYLVLQQKARAFYRASGLDFDRTISLEKKRQQSILSFFALFTTVKGISTSIRRRAYLDRLLSAVPPKEKQVWLHLYWRAFLRSGDYLGLSLRLTVLAWLSLALIRPLLLGVALALLLHYLLLFQLLALYKHYDYHYLTQLFPVGDEGKAKQLQVFLRPLFYLLALVEGILVLSFLEGTILIGGMVILVELYLPYKLKKLKD